MGFCIFNYITAEKWHTEINVPTWAAADVSALHLLINVVFFAWSSLSANYKCHKFCSSLDLVSVTLCMILTFGPWFTTNLQNVTYLFHRAHSKLYGAGNSRKKVLLFRALTFVSVVWQFEQWSLGLQDVASAVLNLFWRPCQQKVSCRNWQCVWNVELYDEDMKYFTFLTETYFQNFLLYMERCDII